MNRRLLVGLLLVPCAQALGAGQQRQAAGTQSSGSARAAPQLTYNQLVSIGYDLLKEARVGEAYLAAMEAARTTPGRFEAYALAALALHVRGDDREAKPFVARALTLAPPPKRTLVTRLATEIRSGLSATLKADPESRRQLDVLRLILEDADKADGRARFNLLHEFLQKSEPFVSRHPDDAQLWVLRAAASVEAWDLVNAAPWANGAGRQAAFQLVRLGQDNSTDKSIRRLMATMDRRGWIYPSNLQIEPLMAEFNSLVKKMGVVSGTSGPSDGSYSTTKHVTYGDLQGDCTSGFRFQYDEVGELNFAASFGKASKDNWTQAGAYFLGIADAAFYAQSVGYGGRLFPAQWEARPYSIRDRKKHIITTEEGAAPRTEDREPNDDTFTLAATSLTTANELAEVLNKIHWACLCQQK